MDLSEIYGDDDAPEYGPAWQGFNEHVQSFTEDPRWKRLNGSDRRHMRALLASCDPLTGHLEMPARDLAELLEVTEETLRLSRLRLVEAGLVVSYRPGTGHTASTYRIARSWEEAADAAPRD